VEGKQRVITLPSALSTISLFWNVTEKQELFRKGTFERESKVDEKFVSIQKRNNSLEGPQKVESKELSSENPMMKIQLGAEVLR